MTNDDLDRLDRLMAEKVMRYEYCREGGVHKQDGHWIYVPAWSDGEGKIVFELDEWTPTTDIAQAMICAEKRGELLLDGFFGPKPFWEAVVNSFSAEADTPALAICKAIAKALEAK